LHYANKPERVLPYLIPLLVEAKSMGWVSQNSLQRQGSSNLVIARRSRGNLGYDTSILNSPFGRGGDEVDGVGSMSPARHLVVRSNLGHNNPYNKSN
jgi:hypothetical protein